MIKFTLLSIILFSFSVRCEETSFAEKAKYFFQLMNKDNVESVVASFYADDIEFTDPIHSIKGSKAIIQYYKSLYENVTYIHFDFSNVIQQADSVVLVWTMKLQTSKLKQGEMVTVDGNSIIKFNSQGKAIYHRDYFDMGEFIYENVPILSFVIKQIKSRLKN